MTPSFTDVTGQEILAASVDAGMEGVVAKRRAGIYLPGRRSRDWIKVKNQRMQEVVIGGYTQGNGNRRSDFGALLLGLPSAGGEEADIRGQGGHRLLRGGPGRPAG